jgi:hypothetical protein
VRADVHDSLFRIKPKKSGCGFLNLFGQLANAQQECQPRYSHLVPRAAAAGAAAGLIMVRLKMHTVVNLL